VEKVLPAETGCFNLAENTICRAVQWEMIDFIPERLLRSSWKRLTPRLSPFLFLLLKGNWRGFVVCMALEAELTDSEMLLARSGKK